MNESALVILRKVPVQAGSKFVFSNAAGSTPCTATPKVSESVRTTADLENDRLHDLRHSYASIAVSSGVCRYLVRSSDTKMCQQRSDTHILQLKVTDECPRRKGRSGVSSRVFHKLNAGSRIAARVIESLKYLKTHDPELRADGGFWFTEAQEKAPPLRNRSDAPINLRKANLLPPSEIAVAIKQVLQQNGALAEDDIPRTVALLFGFQRTGPEFRPVSEPVIEQQLREGDAQHRSAGIRLANETDQPGI